MLQAYFGHIVLKNVCTNNHFNRLQQRQQTQGEKHCTATSKALKIWVSFSKLQSWTLQLQHLQTVHTQDSRKIPTVKGSVCFWSKCVKFTPAEDPVLVVEFIELQPNPTVTNGGKKERNEKKEAPSLQHLPAQAGCVRNPLGPVHGYQQLSKHDQLIIQGYWLILGLLKNPRSNISGIDSVTKRLWKAYRFIYLKLSTLWKIWGWEGVNCLFHICVCRVLRLVPKSQINNILASWFLIVLLFEINSCNMEKQLQEENK